MLLRRLKKCGKMMHYLVGGICHNITCSAIGNRSGDSQLDVEGRVGMRLLCRSSPCMGWGICPGLPQWLLTISHT